MGAEVSYQIVHLHDLGTAKTVCPCQKHFWYGLRAPVNETCWTMCGDGSNERNENERMRKNRTPNADGSCNAGSEQRENTRTAMRRHASTPVSTTPTVRRSRNGARRHRRRPVSAANDQRMKLTTWTRSRRRRGGGRQPKPWRGGTADGRCHTTTLHNCALHARARVYFCACVLACNCGGGASRVRRGEGKGAASGPTRVVCPS